MLIEDTTILLFIEYEALLRAILYLALCHVTFIESET